MNLISILPKHEAQKIAAGEVIERPAHIVKELIENSLDAGATTIDIYLEQAGKKLIRIVDNGSGMSKEDARLCFTKHATSKVRSLNDLETVNSFGFRGEALASIAAVSKVTLNTKQDNHPDKLGISITHEQGVCTSEESVPCPAGTAFSIHDLFYNMPARKKFLRQDSTEVNQVQQLVYATCLSTIEVSVSLHVDGKRVINAPSCKNVRERVTQLWGYNSSQNLTSAQHPSSIKERHPWVRVDGELSHNTFWRHSRDRIFFFVNNRWVKDPDLSKALLKGYGNTLPPGKFPMGIIFITVDPHYVDINVHPKKEEVRFLKPGVVQTLIQQTVQTSLEQYVSEKLSMPPITEQQPAPTIPSSVGKQEPELLNSSKSKHPALEQYFPQTFGIKPPSTKQPTATPVAESIPTPIMQPLPTTTTKQAPQETVKPLNLIPQAPTYMLLGQLFNTYLLIEKEGECIVIDQHAAHERILYEQWKDNFEDIAGVNLLFPTIIKLSEHQLKLVTAAQESFARFGMAVEPFGKQELIIKTSPPKVDHVDLEEIVHEAAIFLEEQATLEADELRKKLYEHMHSHMACKAAVRAGDKLSPSMIKQLIDDLLTVDNRFQCIHGRPTMWIMSKQEIEKKFRRR